MPINQVRSVPRYGSEAKSKILAASAFTSSKEKVYWATGQTANWFQNAAEWGVPGPFNKGVNTYQPSVGWPVANRILALPKVVRFFVFIGGTTQTRLSNWIAIGTALQQNVQGKYPQIPVLLTTVPPKTVWGQNLGLVERWLEPLVPIDFSGVNFLGTDVFNIW